MRMEAIGSRPGWWRPLPRGSAGPGDWLAARESSPPWASEGIPPEARVPELMKKQREAVAGLKAALSVAAKAPPPRRQQRLADELEAMAAAWRISPSNRALLELQRPGTREVRSAAAWARLGRTPREGEAPLHVIVPARGRAVPYLSAPVFELSQTRGHRLEASPPVKGRALLVALEQAWQALGEGRAPGGSRELLEALVRRRLAEERKVEAELRELEVAAAAFVALRALGWTPRAPALEAWHDRSGAAILRSLSRIQRAARAVLASTGALDVRQRA